MSFKVLKWDDPSEKLYFDSLSEEYRKIWLKNWWMGIELLSMLNKIINEYGDYFTVFCYDRKEEENVYFPLHYLVNSESSITDVHVFIVNSSNVDSIPFIDQSNKDDYYGIEEIIIEIPESEWTNTGSRNKIYAQISEAVSLAFH